MAIRVDDWLVADSEDEGTFTQFPTEHQPATAQVNVETPEIHATPSLDDQTLADKSLFTPPPGIDSTISSFTNVPPTSVEPPAMAPKPRPRPRVIIKKPAAPNTASTSLSHVSDAPISTTRQTNDSIHPATATSFGFSDVVEDLYSSFGIAERAKMRSRKSQAVKRSMLPPAQISEIIELTTSDEDELALKPIKRKKKQGDTVPKPKAQTKPRPKPKPKVKATATTLPSSSPSDPPVVRDLPAPSAPCVSSSQPPTSTFPTVPPSTPPQARGPSSPSSPLITTRKRKIACLSVSEDDDEINILGNNPAGVSPTSTVPPPFFAPSSSSVPTDSGIEILPVESHGQGKKKRVSSSKSKPRGKAQKKGKGVEISNTIDEMLEESSGLIQEHSSSFANDCDSLATRNSTGTKKGSERRPVAKKGKGRARVIDSCDEGDEFILPSKSNPAQTPPADEGEDKRSKENLRPDDPLKRDSALKHTPTSGLQIRGSPVKSAMTPMSELIRRVNSQPCSPFPNASRTYSPFLKSSRTMLSRIAPLHPNRRTPPPPLPRPPPPKKGKKQLEMEERIEEELAETVDGWSCLTDEERKALRKARIDAELGYE